MINMDLQDFVKSGFDTFLLWKKGKKSLRDMTDVELTSFEEYLRLYFLVVSSGGSAPSVPALSKRKFFKQILLFPFILLVLFLFFGLK